MRRFVDALFAVSLAFLLLWPSIASAQTYSANRIGYSGSPRPGATYYMAPSSEGGSDSNSGTFNSPWLTPNHAGLACGDTILDIPGTYASANLSVTQTVACVGQNSVVMNRCMSSFACKENNSGSNGWQITASYWGVEGWEVDSANICFAASNPSANVTIGHIAFINNICNGAQQDGIATYNAYSGGSVDNVIVMGNVVFNASQGSTGCYSGISMGNPFPDNTPTHIIYVAFNLSYGNTPATGCISEGSVQGYLSAGTLTVTSGSTSAWASQHYTLYAAGITAGTYLRSGSGSSWTVTNSQTLFSSGSPGTITAYANSDNCGIAFDTWPAYGANALGVAENNYLWGNGGCGFEQTASNGNSNATATPIIFRYNTLYGNELATSDNTTGDINIGVDSTISNGVAEEYNIAQETTAKVTSYNAPAASYVFGNSGATLVEDKNWFYAGGSGSTYSSAFWTSGTIACIGADTITGTQPFNASTDQNVGSTRSYGCSGDTIGTSPAFVSTSLPSTAPSCAGYLTTLLCEATTIADMAATASGSTTIGAQTNAPTDSNNDSPFILNVLAMAPNGMFPSR